MKASLNHTLKLQSSGVISIIGAGGKTRLMFALANELADKGFSVLTTTTTKIYLPDNRQSQETIVTDSVKTLALKAKILLALKKRHLSAGSATDSNRRKLVGFSPEDVDALSRKRLFNWIVIEADGAKHKSVKASDIHEPVIPFTTTHLILVTGLDALGSPLDEDHVHRASIFSKNTGLPLGATLNETALIKALTIEIKKAKKNVPESLKILLLNKADTENDIRSGENIIKRINLQNEFHQLHVASFKNGFKLEATIP